MIAKSATHTYAPLPMADIPTQGKWTDGGDGIYSFNESGERESVDVAWLHYAVAANQ